MGGTVLAGRIQGNAGRIVWAGLESTSARKTTVSMEGGRATYHGIFSGGDLLRIWRFWRDERRSWQQKGPTVERRVWGR